MALSSPPRIARSAVSAYRIPTESQESDGTLDWGATTLVLVTLQAAEVEGLGYTYADSATAKLLHDTLLPLLEGADPMAIAYQDAICLNRLRNLGQCGIAAMAVSALDNALWDLKARLLDLSVASLLGPVRPAIPAYASGGFISWPLEKLRDYMARESAAGFRFVKMKVGRDPQADIERVEAARAALGKGVELFVDANGGYDLKQALVCAERFAAQDVTWFEEPVSSADLAGLRLLRDRAPAGMAISAGEYGYDPAYFRRMLEARAVDVLQADATRCLGLSGFLKAAALCEAFHLPLSSHCAPALQVHACCAAGPACHLEYFHDHARIEDRLFEGAPRPMHGELAPDWNRPGFGLEFRYADARAFALS